MKSLSETAIQWPRYTSSQTIVQNRNAHHLMVEEDQVRPGTPICLSDSEVGISLTRVELGQQRLGDDNSTHRVHASMHHVTMSDCSF
jgi:hypothetical protein